jgi:D-alanyl-D-alanine carboxypeptidase
MVPARSLVLVAALAVPLGAACATSSRAQDVASAAVTESTTPSPVLIATATPSPSEEPSVERDRYAGRISTIPPSIEAEMRGTTWKPGCPVPVSDLRLLRFNYVGFDDEVKRGQMVVNASVAADVLWVFRQLYQARFPLRKVALAKEYKPKHEKPSQHQSVTAAFNCRPAITLSGPTDHFSQHAYGLAVDVNPRQNPEVGLNGRIRDKSAKVYRDRSLDLEGMIQPGDIVVRSFAAIGWKWGGDWHSFKDYMHFSLTGT